MTKPLSAEEAQTIMDSNPVLEEYGFEWSPMWQAFIKEYSVKIFPHREGDFTASDRDVWIPGSYASAQEAWDAVHTSPEQEAMDAALTAARVEGARMGLEAAAKLHDTFATRIHQKELEIQIRSDSPARTLFPPRNYKLLVEVHERCADDIRAISPADVVGGE